MDQTSISDDVMRFILLSVPSVPYLEALLLLRCNAGQHWDSKQIATRLYLSDKAAQMLLAELLDGGVVINEAENPLQYRYQPKSNDLAQIIDRLADIYAKNLVSVSNLIHSKSNKKAQQFADAFIWRKDT